MSEFPVHLRYHPEHTWVAVAASPDADGSRVGVTWTAQDELGEIVFVEPPEPGDTVTAGEPCGELESTKTTSDIIAPVTCTVVQVNTRLAETPGLINDDPYGNGWIFTVRDAVAPDELVDAARYAALNGG